VTVREWVVAGGLVEDVDGAILLVQNRRRNGSLDWTTPGGVIEVGIGESVRDGLTREVAEETGIVVEGWDGPLYRVEAVAEGLGWRLRAEVYRAIAFHGTLTTGDPDGIVVDACFVRPDACGDRLAHSQQWVREPLAEWLLERWAPEMGSALRSFRYRVEGDSAAAMSVVREL